MILVVLLLFGDEPERLNSGGSNVLADLPVLVVVAAGVGAVPFVLAIVRRPRVAANHFALTVRPGWVRTLVLPWSRVAQVVISEIDGERFLLVRCRDNLDRMGDAPRWVDQHLLRALRRAGARQARRFDLAVRMRDFVGSSEGQMAALAAFAPDHVEFADDQHNR